MIISHKYKFIFIKTNKTAGTSIEIALSKFCVDGDVITKLHPGDELLRKSLGYPSAQNYRTPFYNYNLHDWKRMILKIVKKEKRKTRRFYAHSSASEIRHSVGEKIWGNYFKFCFERNPWDRAISYYYFIAGRRQERGKKTAPLPVFISAGCLESLKKKGIGNYTINDEIAVNRICLYENLEAELEYVCNHVLGLPEPLSLPRAKGQFRKDKRHYRDVLSMQDRDHIAQRFSREIEMFGYDF